LAGILADKEWKPMLRPLLARADAAILTTPPTAPASRRWNPEAAAAWAAAATGSSPRLIPDFRSALDRAVTLAPHGTVVVTGSHRHRFVALKPRCGRPLGCRCNRLRPPPHPRLPLGPRPCRHPRPTRHRSRHRLRPHRGRCARVAGNPCFIERRWILLDSGS